MLVEDDALCLRNLRKRDGEVRRSVSGMNGGWGDHFGRCACHSAASRRLPQALLLWTLSPSELALSPLAMKEEGKKEKKEKRENEKEATKKGEKKDKVKKISTVSVPATKKSRTWNELMTAESFRSSSLLVGLTMILVLSTVLLVIVAILVGSFRISLFTMASLNFLAGPIMMVISSTIGILLAVFGFIMVFKRHFNLYIGLAACSLVAFLLQIVAVVLAFILRENIDSDFNKVVVHEEEEMTPTSTMAWCINLNSR